MKKELIVIFSFLVSCFACTDKIEPEKKPTDQIGSKYQIAIAEQADVRQQLKLPGQLAAYQEVSIFPKVNGYVKTVFVDIGSHVKKGQILMILEAPELEQA